MRVSETWARLAVVLGVAWGGVAGAQESYLPQTRCGGAPMRATAESRAADAALTRVLVSAEAEHAQHYRQALEAARRGTRSDARNPLHHLLAAWAAVGLGELREAHGHLQRAAELCPELVDDDELGIEAVRREGWARGFAEGLDAYQANQTDVAVRHWEGAALIWDGAPNAHFNLAIVAGERGDVRRALQHYRTANEINGRLLDGTTRNSEEREEALETRATIVNGLISVGAVAFQNRDFETADEAFRRAIETEPESRDAWYNLALTLYRQERWAELENVAEEVIRRDPLNHNARIVLYNALRGLADAASDDAAARERALAVLEEADSLPLNVDRVMLSVRDDAVEIRGLAIGTAERGQPVTLAFTVYGAGGRLGSGTARLVRPAAEASQEFTVTIPVREPVTGWRYEVR